MYILYLDDSGSTGNQNESYFVLGGVAVPEYSIRWLSHKLETLAETFDPNNPRQVEFHASEIFSGRTGVWKAMNKHEDRIAAIKNVLLCLDGAHNDIAIFACAVHKASFPGRDPVTIAFEEVSSRFDLFLSRRQAVTSFAHKGMIVLDRTAYEESIQNLARDFRSGGNRWGSQLRQICEVPLFVESRASRIIQLADQIAYAVFRRYNAGDLTYYNCMESRLDQDAGRIYGLVHRQTYNPNCTCPSCLSRKQNFMVNE